MTKPTWKCLAVLAALCPALGGCQTTFDLVGVATPLSVSATHNFDGSYQGSVDLVSHTGPGCPAGEGERVVMIGDGVLWYAYSPSRLFTLPVTYDGVIQGTSGDATLLGKITGNRLVMNVKTPDCQTRLQMNSIYNHS